MPYLDTKAVKTQNTSELFTALMLNIWGAGDGTSGPLDPAGDEADLSDFYNEFHNALETARAFGARISNESDGVEIKSDERVVDAIFRDGSTITIGVSGKAIYHEMG